MAIRVKNKTKMSFQADLPLRRLISNPL